MNKICQSCAMPLTSPDLYATNKDGSPNKDYCKWCYSGGKFVDNVSMEQYIEMCSQFGEQAGMTNEQMKEYCQKIFPTLKRWKKQQGNIVASSKEYRDFVLEQLSILDGITCRPMMGEYLLYYIECFPANIKRNSAILYSFMIHIKKNRYTYYK